MSLALNHKDFQEYSFVDIIIAQDAMTDSILELPKTTQWLMLTISWIIILIGSYFRYILYKYLYRKYNNKEFTPINTLKLAHAIGEHVTAVSLILAYTILIVADTSLENVVGPWFCHPISLFKRFGFFYTYAGSFGISIYRILLVKYNVWLKYTIGEKNMLYMILFGGIFLCLY